MGDRVAVMSMGVLQQVDTPAAPLRRAGEPVRRRLHRHAADEPARGGRSTVERRRRDDRRRSTARSRRPALRSQRYRAVRERDGHDGRRRRPRRGRASASDRRSSRRSTPAAGARRGARLRPDGVLPHRRARPCDRGADEHGSRRAPRRSVVGGRGRTSSPTSRRGSTCGSRRRSRSRRHRPASTSSTRRRVRRFGSAAPPRGAALSAARQLAAAPAAPACAVPRHRPGAAARGARRSRRATRRSRRSASTS